MAPRERLWLSFTKKLKELRGNIGMWTFVVTAAERHLQYHRHDLRWTAGVVAAARKPYPSITAVSY